MIRSIEGEGQPDRPTATLAPGPGTATSAAARNAVVTNLAMRPNERTMPLLPSVQMELIHLCTPCGRHSLPTPATSSVPLGTRFVTPAGVLHTGPAGVQHPLGLSRRTWSGCRRSQDSRARHR